MALTYDVFKCPPGWVGVCASHKGLVRLTLPQPTEKAAREEMGAYLGQARNVSDLFTELAERLTRYFEGVRTDFPDVIDLSGATPFQRRVWRVARLISYGETRSYGWIAQQLHKPGAARAVGQALGRNPLPIIVPCHRVLAGDGKLGGFTGGLGMKRYLLALEKGKKTDAIS